MTDDALAAWGQLQKSEPVKWNNGKPYATFLPKKATPASAASRAAEKFYPEPTTGGTTGGTTESEPSFMEKTWASVSKKVPEGRSEKYAGSQNRIDFGTQPTPVPESFMERTSRKVDEALKKHSSDLMNEYERQHGKQ